MVNRLSEPLPLGPPEVQLFGTFWEQAIILALRALPRGHEVACKVAALLEAAQKGIDAALADQIQPLLGELLHQLVAVTWTLRQRREQTHIQGAFEELRRAGVHMYLQIALSCNTSY